MKHDLTLAYVPSYRYVDTFSWSRPSDSGALPTPRVGTGPELLALGVNPFCKRLVNSIECRSFVQHRGESHPYLWWR